MFFTLTSDLHTLIAVFLSRKCLVIFALTPETSEIINEKMTEVELELLENEEMTLDEDKIQVLLDDQQESEEAIVEEMKIQLTGKPVQVFAYRNMKGNIDEGKLSNLILVCLGSHVSFSFFYLQQCLKTWKIWK